MIRCTFNLNRAWQSADRTWTSVFISLLDTLLAVDKYDLILHKTLKCQNLGVGEFLLVFKRWEKIQYLKYILDTQLVNGKN